MTERAQALEALKRVARDIGTVKDVASRRSDPDRDNRRMLARLSAWRSEILRALNILEAVPPPPPVGSPTTEHEHDYVAVELCRHCLRTEADITGECHHCDEGTGARCWWCFKLKSTPVEPAGMTGQVRLCGALHMDTGAVCELPLDHTENHRGSFSRGIAQWPYESVEPAGASEPPSALMGQTLITRLYAPNQPSAVSPVEPTPEPPTEKRLYRVHAGNQTYTVRLSDAEADKFLSTAKVEVFYSPAPTGAPAPCVWRDISTFDVDSQEIILRPHRIWGAMDVRRITKAEGQMVTTLSKDIDWRWINGDHTTAWTEDAFLPFWMPRPSQPLTVER